MWVGLVAAVSIMGSAARGEISVVSCEEAKRLIESSDPAKRPVVIDTRGGYKDYFRSHLPTAHHLNFDTLRGTDRGVPVQYLPDDLTAALLFRAGVDRDRTHLLYATGDKLPNDEILSTSMVAYVLEKFGVRDIRVIDGGLAEWQRLGFATTQEYFGNPKGKLPSQQNASIGIGIDELLTKLGRPGVVLVDARPRNEYLGEDDVWLRKGHIPGAISFHWARLMEPGNTHKFRSPEEASRELASVGLDKGQEVIVYCGTSREGSLLRFYLRHVAGFPNVRLYEGSWKEYAALKQHPAETKENRLK
jgi:thiosulfate/3-mercaptopyruvate sulfurtransferase